MPAEPITPEIVKIEEHLVRRVHELGGEIRKVKWIGRRGAPDRVVMLPERGVITDDTEEGAGRCIGFKHRAATLWVELKAPGEKPNPHQRREHERMRRMGQRVVVIDSIEGVEKLLR